MRPRSLVMRRPGVQIPEAALMGSRCDCSGFRAPCCRGPWRGLGRPQGAPGGLTPRCERLLVVVHGRPEVLGAGEVAVVAQGGVWAGVPEDALDAEDVCAVGEQVRGAGVPQVVDPEPGWDGPGPVDLPAECGWPQRVAVGPETSSASLSLPFAHAWAKSAASWVSGTSRSAPDFVDLTVGVPSPRARTMLRATCTMGPPVAVVRMSQSRVAGRRTRPSAVRSGRGTVSRLPSVRTAADRPYGKEFRRVEDRVLGVPVRVAAQGQLGSGGVGLDPPVLHGEVE